MEYNFIWGGGISTHLESLKFLPIKLTQDFKLHLNSLSLSEFKQYL